MGNPREDARRRRGQTNVVTGPSQSGAPPGERGGPGTTGANEVQWISQPQSAAEYYAPGGQGTTNQNISNPSYPNYAGPPVTGGDPSPGVSTDAGSGSGSSGRMPGAYTTHLVDLFNEITGGNVLEGGIGNLRELSRDTLGGSDPNTINNLENLDTNQPDFTPTIDLENTIQNKINDYIGIDAFGGNFGLNDQGYGFTSGSGNTQVGIQPSLEGFKLGLNTSFADGGPVGLMSLPQGYANGGEVLEESETVEEESTPFGGTRENVWDQVEAFDNAPQHIEEPMIGMWGEKVPLGIARRVQGYMEGLDPVKRNLIQEMMQMFRMKKMMERNQDQEQSGQFFGPQPQEYSI